MPHVFTIDRGEGAVALAYGPFTDADGYQHQTDVLDGWSDEDLAEIGVVRAAEPLADLAQRRVDQVNAYRDQRISGGFPFAGKTIQSRSSDRENISTLGVLAQLAVAGGAEAGDLRWADPDSDFEFICADNTLMALDAQGMVGLFMTGIGFKKALTFAGRAKKNWLLDPARTREQLEAFVPTADWPV